TRPPVRSAAGPASEPPPSQPRAAQPGRAARRRPGGLPVLRDLRAGFTASRLNWLLLFIPISIVLDLLRAGEVWIFLATALAIVPLAGIIGHATEQLSLHAGPGIGGPLD